MDRPVMGEVRHQLPSLIVSLPIGLWLVSLGADVAYRSGRAPAPAAWDDVAFFSLFGGLVAAVLIVGPGLVDDLVAGVRMRLARPGRLELHLAVVMLYTLNLCLRAYASTTLLPIWLSFAGVTLLVISAGIGGESAHASGAHPVRPCPREVLIVTRRRRTARSA